MATVDIKRQIAQKLDLLSPSLLAAVNEFLGSLLAESRQASFAAEGSLLGTDEVWVGDDFEECLQSVYDTRSQIKA